MIESALKSSMIATGTQKNNIKANRLPIQHDIDSPTKNTRITSCIFRLQIFCIFRLVVFILFMGPFYDIFSPFILLCKSTFQT